MAEGEPAKEMMSESRIKRKATDTGENVAKRPCIPYMGTSQELQVLSFANSRALEIKSLKQDVNQRSRRLPPHMRRRAMNHNIKRLPRNLRASAAKERRQVMNNSIKRLPRNIRASAAKEYVHQKGLTRKTPSRYHRRRPRNLLAEYQRRNRKHVWLETHIWHAKRFHMVEKWGFKLAWKPTDKSHRAAYRATRDHCLLQDLSFMCCLELSGDQDHLLERLSHLTSKETGLTFASKACLGGNREGFTVLYEMYQYPWKAIGLTFASKACLGGNREGFTVLYEMYQYPWKAIGPVNFMWKNLSTDSEQSDSVKAESQPSSGVRTMWIWCHPAIFDLVWTELGKCFKLIEKPLKTTEKSSEQEKSGAETVNGDGKQQDNKPCIVDKYKTEVLYVNEDSSVMLKSLTGSILRYRLNGPQSNTIVADICKQANIIPVQDRKDSSDPWWKTYYKREDTLLSHGAQREFMENLSECQSPAELPPHCIVATTAQDPRLGRPVKKFKMEGRSDNISSDTGWCRQKITPDMSMSPLWDQNIRDEVTRTKQLDYKIAELKSELLIPGSCLELGDEESKIPVILIQRPGVTDQGRRDRNVTPGRGSGWDLLLPKGWGMAFWLGLVYRGARCNGLLEQENSVYEDRSLLFPHNYPDTQAALQHYSETEDTLLKKYNRTPPAKRPNFTKLGVPFPYNHPWNLMTEFWNGANKTIDGNENILKESSEIERAIEVGVTPSNTNQVLDTDKQFNTDTTKDQQPVIEKQVDTTRKYFVLRNQSILRQLNRESIGGKGGCGRNKSTKLKPEHSVFEMIEKSFTQALIPVRVEMLSRGMVDQYSTICIPLEEDMKSISTDPSYGGPLEPKHIDPKLTLKKKLKREMKEKKFKKKVKVDRTLKKMCDRDDLSFGVCSRSIFGFVCQGGFSLGTGTGAGVGFVSGSGLVEYVRKGFVSDHKWIVLVRNNTSLQYRPARLSVIV